MKRKLDTNDEPAPVQPEAPAKEERQSFASFGLDHRLLQGIAAAKFKEPTLVQRKAIPAALDGQDVLAKSKTGSGKTAAYLLPVIHSILRRKATDSAGFTSALILVPTRELANQVFRVTEQLTAFCAQDVTVAQISDKVSEAVQRSLLASAPDVVICTPAKASRNIAGGALSTERLRHVVVDESDLVLSYGYEEDLQGVARALPRGVQAILMSATLTPEIDTLKGIFCRNPTLLDLEESGEASGDVTQYYIRCAEADKFLLAGIIYQLKLVKKSIIFVSDIDRCYRLKLYFEQFGIRSCVLNSELPVNSRIHVVEEFNKNVYNIIIASDEHEVLGDEGDIVEDEEGDEGGDTTGASRTKAKAKASAEEGDRPSKKQKTSRKHRDAEYGVSRGIDFKNVACVVNFDLPTSAKSYTHRIGRTARAGQNGMALSFVIPKEQYRKHPPTWVESTEKDEKILQRIVRQQAKRGKEVKPYQFDMKQAESFRYRMNDALRAVTRVAIREARIRELRQELLKSEKLRRHFEENPSELHHLRHDGELRSAKTQPHMKHVPDYMLPADGRGALARDVGFVPFRSESSRKNKRTKGSGGMSKVFKRGGKKADPLKTFRAGRKGK